jgi:ABC-type multidrug transport system ATPase subunit
MFVTDVDCFLSGLNGAGKTTTFGMLTGAESVTSGQIFMFGQRMKKEYWNSSDYRNISLCPQHDSIFKRMTVKQTVLFYLKAHGAPSSNQSRIAKRLIELCDLTKFTDSTADTLSGGNKRKLSLAVSLVGSPSLILLDEPTTGVDPVARRKLWKCLELYRRIGKCLIHRWHLILPN